MRVLGFLILLMCLGTMFVLGLASTWPEGPDSFQRGPGRAVDPSDVLVYIFAGLVALGTVMLALGLAWVMASRRKRKKDEDERVQESPKVPVWQGIAAVALMCLAAAAILIPVISSLKSGEVPTSLPGLEISPGDVPEYEPGQRGPVYTDPRIRGSAWDWWFLILVGAAIVASLVYAGLLIAGRRTREEGVPASAEPSESIPNMASEFAEIALAELEREPDTRLAVIRCYEQFLLLAEKLGFPAQPHYTPEEYVAKALALFPIPSAVLWSLTELFERARFSEHRMSAEDRAAAISALAEIRSVCRGS
ncbi:MAG: DUF4129 domain-containing protein [Firmicutes bacterium]|nr:DUF4129 domain-containing protein [Bacillota bacterium]